MNYLNIDAESSRPDAAPVAGDFVSLPHLLSELFVSAVFDCVDLESVRVDVDVVVLGEEVGDAVKHGKHPDGSPHGDLGVWVFRFVQIGEILRNIVSHLWGGSWGSVVILDHAVVELWGHTDNHVIEIRVEITAL